jgi:hypothetical protein
MIVPLPVGSVRRDARLVRLRLPDRPGSLAGIASDFADHGVNVLRLEVLATQSGWAVDDFLVSGSGVGTALKELPPEVTVLANRPGVDLVDPGLAMASACAAVTVAVSALEACRQLVGAALGLVFAEAGFVCVRIGQGFLRPVASTVAGLPALDGEGASLLRSALFSGESLSADGRAPWAPPELRDRLPGGSVAVIPGGTPPFFVLVLVREDDAPFVAAELDRLAALLLVTAGTLQLHDVNRTLGRRGRSSTGSGRPR